MIEKLRYFFKLAGDNLWRFRGRNAFSVTIICLSFLTVGLFISFTNNINFNIRKLSDNMLLVFFLDSKADEAQIKSLTAEISASPLVKDVRCVGAAEALERFKKNFPDLRDLVESLKDNPFPASIEARVVGRAAGSAEAARFIEAVKKRPAVTDTQYNQEWVERLKAISRVTNALGFFFGGILILASFFIVSNVIKLNVFARKNEVEILRLVGATNLFIRVPFWLEGIALGLTGGLISLGLLFILTHVFPLYVGPSLGVLHDLLAFHDPDIGQALWIIGGGAATGFLGSATSVSKFLKA